MKRAGIVLLPILLAVVSFAGSGKRYSPTTLVYPTYKHDLGMHHVHDLHLRLYTGNRHRFVNPRGIAAVKLRERDHPDRKGDDDELTVYGVNSGEHVIIYNTSMYGLDIYGSKGSGKGQFLHPWGIAADPEGNVYVADTGNNRIVHLRYTRGKLNELRTFGGGRPVHFDSPRGVAVGTDGAVYITDTGNNRIVILEKNGRLRGVLGEGLFQRPEAIAMIDRDEKWSYRPASFLIVVDRNGSRVQKLDLGGSPLRAVEGGEIGAPGGRFRGAAIDYYHQIYLTDEVNHQVHKLDSRLRPITSFGRKGEGDAEFQSPQGIALWRRFGQIFLSESTGAQYYWIGVDIVDYYCSPARVGESGKIHFTNTERARVTLAILDHRGDPVRTLVDNRVVPTGLQRFRWDGSDEEGNRLPPGQYTVRIKARPTYSSSEYFEKEVEFPLILR